MGKHVISVQERRRTYDVALSRVDATTVAMEKQNMLHIISVCL